MPLIDPDRVIEAPGPWTHRQVSANGARFHVVEVGEGPAVLLMHGFPMFWWTWRHQLIALADAGYRALRGQRERWLNDYLHKLSCGIVRSCVKRGVQALVLGQNKGWKDGAEMGRTQNRRFARIPHARLVELLTKK